MERQWLSPHRRPRWPVLVLLTVLLATLLLVPVSGAGPGEPDPALAPTTSLLGPEVQISTPSTPLDANRHLPAVTYNWNRDQYLVVWHNQWPGNRDIYGQRVSRSGQRVGPWFAISAGSGDRVQPAVVYNGYNDEYLIVWMKEVNTDVYEIWGRIIAWDNSYQKPEFQIITWPKRSFYTPKVAWNSYRNEYFVVWNAFNTETGFPPGVPNDIAGARISSSGSVLDTKILATYSAPHQADLVYNVAMDEYFLTFVVVHSEATTGNDIYGLRVKWDGTSLTPPGLIKIYDGSKHQNHPAVATNSQDRYMVVWEHEYAANDHDIYGREYNADGTPAGSFFSISSWTDDDTVPQVAAPGGRREWVTVWQRALPAGAGYSIHGYRWGSGPNPVKAYLFDVANWAFYECKYPAVAASRPGYLIVYEELAPGPRAAANLTAYQHIYGRTWVPEAVFLPLVTRKH
jgi:hypothetical protein